MHTSISMMLRRSNWKERTINSVCFDQDKLLLSIRDTGTKKRIVEYCPQMNSVKDIDKISLREEIIDFKHQGSELIVRAVQGRENRVTLNIKGVGFKTLPIEFKTDFPAHTPPPQSRILSMDSDYLFFIAKTGELVKTCINPKSYNVASISSLRVASDLVHIDISNGYVYCLTSSGTLIKVSSSSFKEVSRVELRPTGFQWNTVACRHGALVLSGIKMSERTSIISLLGSDLCTYDQVTQKSSQEGEVLNFRQFLIIPDRQKSTKLRYAFGLLESCEIKIFKLQPDKIDEIGKSNVGGSQMSGILFKTPDILLCYGNGCLEEFHINMN